MRESFFFQTINMHAVMRFPHTLFNLKFLNLNYQDD
ncbi:hypothetical protein M2364_002094 [Acinetobacter johnsonii]|nr:hypothetical protein [Acinetobacter johnsonii]